MSICYSIQLDPIFWEARVLSSSNGEGASATGEVGGTEKTNLLHWSLYKRESSRHLMQWYFFSLSIVLYLISISLSMIGKKRRLMQWYSSHTLSFIPVSLQERKRTFKATIQLPLSLIPMLSHIFRGLNLNIWEIHRVHSVVQLLQIQIDKKWLFSSSIRFNKFFTLNKLGSVIRLIIYIENLIIIIKNAYILYWSIQLWDLL